MNSHAEIKEYCEQLCARKLDNLGKTVQYDRKIQSTNGDSEEMDNLKIPLKDWISYTNQPQKNPIPEWLTGEFYDIFKEIITMLYKLLPEKWDREHYPSHLCGQYSHTIHTKLSHTKNI